MDTMDLKKKADEMKIFLLKNGPQLLPSFADDESKWEKFCRVAELDSEVFIDLNLRLVRLPGIERKYFSKLHNGKSSGKLSSFINSLLARLKNDKIYPFLKCKDKLELQSIFIDHVIDTVSKEALVWGDDVYLQSSHKSPQKLPSTAEYKEMYKIFECFHDEMYDEEFDALPLKDVLDLNKSNRIVKNNPLFFTIKNTSNSSIPSLEMSSKFLFNIDYDENFHVHEKLFDRKNQICIVTKNILSAYLQHHLRTECRGMEEISKLFDLVQLDAVPAQVKVLDIKNCNELEQILKEFSRNKFQFKNVDGKLFIKLKENMEWEDLCNNVVQAVEDSIKFESDNQDVKVSENVSFDISDENEFDDFIKILSRKNREKMKPSKTKDKTAPKIQSKSQEFLREKSKQINSSNRSFKQQKSKQSKVFPKKNYQAHRGVQNHKQHFTRRETNNATGPNRRVQSNDKTTYSGKNTIKANVTTYSQNKLTKGKSKNLTNLPPPFPNYVPSAVRRKNDESIKNSKHFKPPLQNSTKAVIAVTINDNHTIQPQIRLKSINGYEQADRQVRDPSSTLKNLNHSLQTRNGFRIVPTTKTEVLEEVRCEERCLTKDRFVSVTSQKNQTTNHSNVNPANFESRKSFKETNNQDNSTKISTIGNPNLVFPNNLINLKINNISQISSQNRTTYHPLPANRSLNSTNKFSKIDKTNDRLLLENKQKQNASSIKGKHGIVESDFNSKPPSSSNPFNSYQMNGTTYFSLENNQEISPRTTDLQTQTENNLPDLDPLPQIEHDILSSPSERELILKILREDRSVHVNILFLKIQIQQKFFEDIRELLDFLEKSKDTFYLDDCWVEFNVERTSTIVQ